MSPLLFQLLKRLTVGALALAVLLGVGTRVLREVGVIGPSVDEVVAASAATVEVARTYGATDALPAFAAAERELAQARAAAGQGQGREARRAAASSREHAVRAQREALLRRDQERRGASAVAAEVDRRLNELEAVYGRAAKGLDKKGRAELIGLMKTARQAGSGLILAYEQRDYARVLAEAPKAMHVLDGVRERLARAAGAAPPAS
jgi:hypothetical protein